MNSSSPSPKTALVVKNNNVILFGSFLVSAMGWGFFTSFLGIMIWTLVNTHQDQLQSVLNDSQKEKYKQICYQRFQAVLYGILAGVIPAFVLSLSCGFRLGHFLFYLFFVVYTFYGLYPKQYLLDYLTNTVQIKAYVKTYDFMKHLSCFGFLLGFLLYILVVWFSSGIPSTSPCKLLF